MRSVVERICLTSARISSSDGKCVGVRAIPVEMYDSRFSGLESLYSGRMSLLCSVWYETTDWASSDVTKFISYSDHFISGTEAGSYCSIALPSSAPFPDSPTASLVFPQLKSSKCQNE